VTLPDAANAVYSLLEEITLRPRADFRGALRLNHDLQVGRESYTLRLIPQLERRLGIQPSLPEWESVATVQDLLTLTEAHLLRGQFLVASP
jgi:hypothetical protein